MSSKHSLAVEIRHHLMERPDGTAEDIALALFIKGRTAMFWLDLLRRNGHVERTEHDGERRYRLTANGVALAEKTDYVPPSPIVWGAPARITEPWDPERDRRDEMWETAADIRVTST